jgi:hypothetical protein
LILYIILINNILVIDIMSIKKPTFRTSSIATLCGFNPYTNKDKQKIVDLLFKYYTDIYEYDDDYINENELFDNLVKQSKDLTEIIEKYKTLDIDNTKTLMHLIDDSIKEINHDLYLSLIHI